MYVVSKLAKVNILVEISVPLHPTIQYCTSTSAKNGIKLCEIPKDCRHALAATSFTILLPAMPLAYVMPCSDITPWLSAISAG